MYSGFKIALLIFLSFSIFSCSMPEVRKDANFSSFSVSDWNPSSSDGESLDLINEMWDSIVEAKATEFSIHPSEQSVDFSEVTFVLLNQGESYLKTKNENSYAIAESLANKVRKWMGKEINGERKARARFIISNINRIGQNPRYLIVAIALESGPFFDISESR